MDNNIMLYQSYYTKNTIPSNIFITISSSDINNTQKWNKIIQNSEYNKYIDSYIFKLPDYIFNNRIEYEDFHHSVINKDMKEYLINELNNNIVCLDYTIPLYY